MEDGEPLALRSWSILIHFIETALCNRAFGFAVDLSNNGLGSVGQKCAN
tara:strand:+ start:45 stop:191 length:147 start_codon:yes stop_codon:yes gene_type:complete